MSMSDQPPPGNPDQPQQPPPGYPPPSQPYYPPAYPQPSSPYPPPSQPMYPGGDAPAGAPYPQPSQPYYPNQPSGQPPAGYPPAGYPPPSQPVYPGQPGQPSYPGYPPPAWPPTNGETVPGQSGYPPSGAYPPGYPPSFAPSLTPVTPAANTNMLGLIIGGGALIVILALLGSLFFLGKGGTGPLAALGATPTPVPTATALPTATPKPGPVVPSGFSIFKASDGSYSIAYPSDWITQGQATQGIQEELFGSPDRNSVLGIIPFPSLIPTSEYTQLLQGLSQGASNLTISPKITRVKLGANTWNKQTATLTLRGTPFSAGLLGTDHNGATTLLLELVPTAQLASVDKADFTPMIKTFTFSA